MSGRPPLYALALGALAILLGSAPSGGGLVTSSVEPRSAALEQDFPAEGSGSDPQLERLRQRDPSLVQELEDRFAAEGYEPTRLLIAAQLVYLKSDDPKYWELIAGRAKAAAERGAPPVFWGRFPGDDALNPDFERWAEERGLSIDHAFQLVAAQDPLAIRFLGATADERAQPLLLKALGSATPTVVSQAALGLARLGSEEAIPAIEEAARTIPESMRWAVAEALLYFDDEGAQAAAAELVTDSRLLEEMKRKAEGGRRAIFGF